jgi:hypothetical protein
MVIDAPWQECECGSIMFTQTVSIKRISKLLTGAPNDEVVEIPLLKCDSCGKVPGFIHKAFPDFPENLRATALNKQDNMRSDGAPRVETDNSVLDNTDFNPEHNG